MDFVDEVQDDYGQRGVVEEEHDGVASSFSSRMSELLGGARQGARKVNEAQGEGGAQ